MKKMMVAWGAIVLITALLAGTAQAAPLKVLVSILPQKYFVERIGGSLVDVSVMVQPGASPATYEPKPRQMADLTRTSIYFAIGAPFEATWLKRISETNPAMKIVPTQAGIEKRRMEADRHHDQPGAKETGDDHSGEILDPHIWTSPPLVEIQARNILTALVEADPGHAETYRENHRKLDSDLKELDLELREMFAERQGLEFLVFHPAWGYFADTYGLHQVPVEIEGKEPKPAQLRNLIELARKKGIKVIFVQPQFSARSAEVVASSIGGQVVPADPLAENWLENMREQARKFKEALR